MEFIKKYKKIILGIDTAIMVLYLVLFCFNIMYESFEYHSRNYYYLLIPGIKYIFGIVLFAKAFLKKNISIDNKKRLIFLVPSLIQSLRLLIAAVIIAIYGSEINPVILIFQFIIFSIVSIPWMIYWIFSDNKIRNKVYLLMYSLINPLIISAIIMLFDM